MKPCISKTTSVAPVYFISMQGGIVTNSLVKNEWSTVGMHVFIIYLTRD